MLGTNDVTTALSGGSIGANIALRDTKLPQLQAGLDSFAQTLASRFQAQGLALFSTPSGAVPSVTAAIGFSLSITVNPAVAGNPAAVRDGTNAVTGSAAGASAFTPNPSGGPAGFTTLIQRVLSFGFGSDVQNGVAQPSAPTKGLGPAGNVALDYSGSGTLGDLATAFTGDAAAKSAGAQTASSNASALQTALTKTFSASSSVSVDQQMGTLVALQNAYAANAKVVSIAQTMWQTLEGMVQ
jgi:flagellar hook-associated protein 1 FlgK